MKIRVISAAVLLPVLLVVVLALPAWGTAVLFGLAGALAAYELLFQTRLVTSPRLVVYAMVMAFLTSLWSLKQDANLARIGILLYCVALFSELLFSHRKVSVEKVCVAFAGGLLVPYLLTSLVRIRAMSAGPDPSDTELGKYYVLIAFIVAFSADTGAYFAGRAFGKHKLAPVVSPKKTIEGAVGGVLSSILLVELYGVLLHFTFSFDVVWWYGILYGLLGAVISILGDLTFSVVKRQVGIKDYSNLIPGHGGILDRFDSMLLVAPVVEILLRTLTFAVPVVGMG